MKRTINTVKEKQLEVTRGCQKNTASRTRISAQFSPILPLWHLSDLLIKTVDNKFFKKLILLDSSNQINKL